MRKELNLCVRICEKENRKIRTVTNSRCWTLHGKLGDSQRRCYEGRKDKKFRHHFLIYVQEEIYFQRDLWLFCCWKNEESELLFFFGLWLLSVKKLKLKKICIWKVKKFHVCEYRIVYFVDCDTHSLPRREKCSISIIILIHKKKGSIVVHTRGWNFCVMTTPHTHQNTHQKKLNHNLKYEWSHICSRVSSYPMIKNHTNSGSENLSKRRRKNKKRSFSSFLCLKKYGGQCSVCDG